MSPEVKSVIKKCIVAVLSIIVAALAAQGTVDLVEKDEPTAVKPTPTPTTEVVVPDAVAVDGPDKNAAPDTVLELDEGAERVAEDVAENPGDHDFAPYLVGTEPIGPVAEHEGPLATPNFPGCRTKILPTNWSNRLFSMSAVDAIGVHYTAGANRAGKSDMDGLTGYASSPSAGVSWHFLIDAEGHCYYQVPLSKKAWTIGNLNSQTVNIEVVGRGSEKLFPAGSDGARKLSKVIFRIGRRLEIPMRLGAVSNCRVTRSGIITHWMGGGCSGGHHDIKPYDINNIVRRARNAGCDKKCTIRRANARNHEARADLRCKKKASESRGPRCTKLHREHKTIHNRASRAGVKF